MLIGFTLLNTFKTPAPVSSVAIDHRGLSAFLGSNDGTLRWYSFNFPGPTRVAKAVRGLGEEISSIAIPRKEGESAGRHYHGRDRSVWVGAGKNVRFDWAS